MLAMSMVASRATTVLRLSTLGLWALALAGCHESSTSPAPSLSLAVSPDGQALVGVTEVAFTATVSDSSGGSINVSWDFGDGQTASGPSVVHVYAREGVFAVGVTVTSGHGGSAAAGTTVTVGDLNGNWTLSQGGGKFYEWGFDITQKGSTLGGRPYAVPDHGCTSDLAGTLTSPRTLRFQFVACDGNTVVIDGTVAGDLRSIPGTYTHPDGPPQPMVLSRQ
jgi:PKD repeat protein